MPEEIAIKWKAAPQGLVFRIFAGDRTVSLTNKYEFENEISAREQLLLQILEQLVDEEKAQIQENEIIVFHDTIASLPLEERMALRLPEPYPFQIQIRASGNLSSPNFKYIYSYLDGRSQPFVNPKRIGCYVEISSSQTYLLDKDLFALIESLDTYNNKRAKARTSQVIKDNLLVFSKIKGLAQKTGAELDTYLNNEQVVAPSKIGIRLKKIDRDTIEVEPVLCDGEEDEGAAESKNFLKDTHAEGFLRTFDRFPEVREMYAVPKGPRIVFNDHQKEALGQLKNNRRLSGKTKDSFLEQPQEYLDPEVFDLDDFGERVKAIGEYRPRSFPFLKPAREPWIPPEGGIIVDGAMVYVAPNEMPKFKEKLEQAIHEGKKEVLWKGETITANEEVIKAVDDLAQIFPSEETTSEEAVDEYQKGNKGRHVLIIRDNFDEIDYSTEQPQVRPGGFGLPNSLRDGVRLLRHQKRGLEWLQKLWIGGAGGALLADDMGLGKTLQALAFLAWIRELMEAKSIKEKPILIVAPVALLKNWAEEYRRFLEPIFGPFLELHGTGLRKFKNLDAAKDLNIKKEIDIKNKVNAEEIMRRGRGVLLNHNEIGKMGAVLTTYETVRDYQFSLGLIDWAVIVLDECQKIKTPSAMVTTAVKAMKYDFGLCLTGTPVENSWVDLWSIIDFVQPGRLGSLKMFTARFQSPLKKKNTDREALGHELKSQIGSLLKRRMKEDYLEGLPKRYINTYQVEMPPKQLNQYLQVIRKAHETLPDRFSGKRKQHILNIIASLRDISLHPYLPYYSEEGLAGLPNDEIINTSARLKKTMEILDEIRIKKEKAIIFVISRKIQRILQKLIQTRYGIECLRPVNGEVAGGRRKELVDKFQAAKGFNVIIMSPEAAGVGLNVTAANHVIHLSRAWNPAKEDQATDRVYRIGQKLPVTIHIPMAVHPMFNGPEVKGTFDLKLHRLLEDKRKLSRSVLLPPVVEENEWNAFAEETIQAPHEESTPEIRISINDIDGLSPSYFEKVVAALYEQMGYYTELTPLTRDYGADIVALGKDNSLSLLIQCKHTSNPHRTVGQSGVREVLSAGGVYGRDYDREFSKVVITNAISFTDQAREVASLNGVTLCAREGLAALLNKYKVCKEDML